ncbi:MAG: HlyD family efflux transporter periplasmic adaptor subunit [Bacteroidaceae bacterium]|nr:HlyD family efflux transporter periplasmic adaptor subunit [Bacteroidaceae bacterium]
MRLQKEKQSHDSATTRIRLEILAAERKAADLHYEEKRRETDGLVTVAPADGQLGHLNLTVGQSVTTGAKVGELKIMDRYKVRTQLNEYYVERIHTGLPATVIQKQDTFRMRISRVMPEVKDRKFETDLLFCSDIPENIRLGKSYRVRIELSRPEQTIIVPRGDFYKKTGGQWIFRIDKHTGVARRTKIKVGRMNPEQCEIVSGLKPGDRVIIDGYELLEDAEEVTID